MTFSTEKKVGLFFLAALVALGIFIELVEEWNPFEDKVHYQAFFESAVGIGEGDPVRLAGVQVGKITAIGLGEGRVRVDFYVRQGTELKEDTVAQIRQTNLLGGQFLGLDFGSPQSPPLPPGSEVQTRESANLEQVIASFDRNQKRVFGTLGDILDENRLALAEAVDQLDSIMYKIDQGEGTLGRLVNDPGLYDQLQEAVGGLEGVLVSLQQGEGTLGRLLNDPELADDVGTLVGNLRQVSDGLSHGEGTLGRLFTDDRFYAEATDALANLRSLTEKADSGEGTLGRLIHDDSLYVEARGAMGRIHSIASKIDEGEGTLGLLVNEQGLYRDAKTTLNKVEKTVDGLSDSGPLSALGVVLGTLF